MEISRLMLDGSFRHNTETAPTADDMVRAIDRYAARTAPSTDEASDQADEGLRYSGRLCGGLMADLRRRWPHYLSDFRDGLNGKCLASILFLVLACLAPAVTFGGVMAVQTDGQIGAIEMIVATAVCGIVYALFAGQPLIILGGTGPLLILTAILNRLCDDLAIPFLPTYTWVGIWTAGFTILLAVTDASCVMLHVTRFTDDIFPALDRAHLHL